MKYLAFIHINEIIHFLAKFAEKVIHRVARKGKDMNEIHKYDCTQLQMRVYGTTINEIVKTRFQICISFRPSAILAIRKCGGVTFLMIKTRGFTSQWLRSIVIIYEA